MSPAHFRLLLGFLGFVGAFPLSGPARAADTDIRLSSIGYLPLRAKRASIVGAATTFSVVRDSDAGVVVSGSVTGPVNDADTGESVSIADFTSVVEPGTYHLEVDGIGRSVSFPIDPDVYRTAFSTTMLGFYGWRCGTAVAFDHGGTHFGYPLCHQADAQTEPLGGTGMRDGLGGWHDAGDYGKYTVNSALAAGTLLAAWEEYQGALEGFALQIPETGGALPDFLVELQWELRWILKMQYSPTDGRVSHKITEASHPGFIMPQSDTSSRSFTPYGTGATADFVAVLAKASRIYRAYDPAFADQCLAAARVSWDYLLANPGNVVPDETGFIGPQYTSTDEDDRLWAAAEMWETVGDDALLTDLQARLAILSPPLVSVDFDWPNLKNLGLFVYLASERAGRADALVKALTESVVSAATTLVGNHNVGGYGRALTNYYWGSNGSVARSCMLLQVANRLAPNSDFVDTCADQLAYLFGRNAYDRSQVTGLGINPPMHPHHRPSAADGIVPPYPGLLVGGGWAFRQISGPPVIPACTLPAGSCWADDEANYSTNEVAINWNAALVYALASFIGGGPQIPSGVGPVGAAGAPGSGGMSAAGGMDASGGVPASGGTDDTGSSGGRHNSKSSGCGCRSATGEGSGLAWLGALAVLGLAERRRRSVRARG